MESINEKIKFSDFLLALGFTYISISNYNKFDQIKNIYNVANSDESKPNYKESKWIDSVKQEVIEEIQTSKLFNKFDKKYIIDSIRTINFRIVDSIIPFAKEAKACYVHIKPLKNKYKYLLKSQIPSFDNFIIINRSDMNDPSYSASLVHEIYHYFDYLLGDGEDYSNTNKIRKFIDKNIDDREYLKEKILRLTMIDPEKNKKEKNLIKSIINFIYYDFMDNKSYYTSNDELFARYKTVKFKMIKRGIITKDETIGIESIAKYLALSNNRIQDIIPFIALDLNKLDELDKLL